MILHRVFDEVFRSWSHIAVLRALVDTTTGFTGNEIARVSEMTPRAALKALTTLETLGLVRRQRGGRDHLFTLNREHFLVNEIIVRLYHTERQFPEVVFTTLTAHLKGQVVSAVAFGSVVRKEETAESDLDICCIVKHEKHKDLVREALNSNNGEFYRKFSVRVAPLLFTVEEFRMKAAARNSLVRQIADQGQVLAGKNPKELLHG